MRIAKLVCLIIFLAGCNVLAAGLAINAFSLLVGGWPELISLVVGPILMAVGGLCFLLFREGEDLSE